MQSIKKNVKCYNEVASNYADKFGDELSHKLFDRLLLKEFASVNKDNGPVADFGCGPGQTTKYLFDHGVKEIIGVDISTEMVSIAQKTSPEIKFENGDILNLPYTANYFGNAIAFYAIVHFSNDQMKIAFTEIHRVLKKGGQFLFSFHVGDEVIHFDTFLDKEVDIDFFFFQTDEIVALLNETGFKLVDVVERYPYKEEYASKRAYIWAKK